MNNALLIIIVFMFLAMICLLWAVGKTLYRYYFPLLLTQKLNLTSACQPSLDSLIDAGNGKICNDGNIYLPSLGMIVSLVQTPYITACSTACVNGYDSSKQICIVPSENEIFQRCLSETQPIGCTSLSNPVARNNTNYYYVAYVGQC